MSRNPTIQQGAILWALHRAKGARVSGKTLAPDLGIDANTLKVQIHNLRKKGFPIQSVTGCGGGYWIERPETKESA